MVLLWIGREGARCVGKTEYEIDCGIAVALFVVAETPANPLD